MKHSNYSLLFVTFVITIGFVETTNGQDVIEKEITILPKKISEDSLGFRLLAPAADREHGNAAPTLLRMTHETNHWMNRELPKLSPEFAARDPADAELQAFIFGSFAEQIIRAGNMSHADWGYPLYSSRPYEVLLPDAQMMRYFLGWGMTVWIKQQIAKGDFAAALRGMQAQLSCARHLAATPLTVCQIIGKFVAWHALENFELLIQQSPEVENMYWALAVLPRSIGDLSATAEWETLAFRKMLPSLTEPMPEMGSDRWPIIANEFITFMQEFAVLPDDEGYSQDEMQTVTTKLDQIASRFLQEELDWTEVELGNATIEERIMRWVLIQRLWFDRQTEQMSVVTIPEALEIHRELRKKSESYMQESGLRHDLFFSPSLVMLNGFQFTRQVRFLQTIESIRDHAARHQGQLPENLDTLKFPAPLDPFTNAPFEYRKNGEDAWLSYPPVAGDPNPTRSYHLTRQQ